MHLPHPDNYNPKPVMASSFYLQCMGLAVVVWWFCMVVNGLLPQLQMKLLGGAIVLPNSAMKAVMMAVVAAMVAIRGIKLAPRGVAYWWEFFFAFLAFETLYFMATTDFSAAYLLASFGLYYFLLLPTPFGHALQGLVNGQKLVYAAIVLFIPLALLGLEQFLTTDPILPTRSNDGYFIVFAWNYWLTGDVRAFSLFSSSAHLGYYCTLIASFLTVLAFRMDLMRRIYIILPLMLLAIATIYATIARTIYIETLCAILASWLIVRARSARPGWLVMLPVLFWFVGYMVVSGGPDLIRFMGLGDHSLFSSDSLGIRREAWTIYSDRWLGQDWQSALLGTGIIQSGEMSTEGYVLIDNAFIAVGLQVGLVGLFLWLGLQWQMWRYVLQTALTQRSVLATGVAGVWATWPLSCMFNSTTIFYTVLFILMLSVKPEDGRVAGNLKTMRTEAA